MLNHINGQKKKKKKITDGNSPLDHIMKCLFELDCSIFSQFRIKKMRGRDKSLKVSVLDRFFYMPPYQLPKTVSNVHGNCLRVGSGRPIMGDPPVQHKHSKRGRWSGVKATRSCLNFLMIYFFLEIFK